MPARASPKTSSGVADAGPSVATILVRRGNVNATVSIYRRFASLLELEWDL
jgi:hypothetical protein